jgi:hypothetical protein
MPPKQDPSTPVKVHSLLIAWSLALTCVAPSVAPRPQRALEPAAVHCQLRTRYARRLASRCRTLTELTLRPQDFGDEEFEKLAYAMM